MTTKIKANDGMACKVIPIRQPCNTCGCDKHPASHRHDVEFEPTCVSCLADFFGGELSR